jgi:hypothetical protein
MKTKIKVRLGLTVRAQNLLLHNRRIKDKIAASCGVVAWTVHRWIRDNDSDITQASAMKVIRDETGLTDDLILQEIPQE